MSRYSTLRIRVSSPRSHSPLRLLGTVRWEKRMLGIKLANSIRIRLSRGQRLVRNGTVFPCPTNSDFRQMTKSLHLSRIGLFHCRQNVLMKRVLCKARHLDSCPIERSLVLVSTHMIKEHPCSIAQSGGSFHTVNFVNLRRFF